MLQSSNEIYFFLLRNHSLLTSIAVFNILQQFFFSPSHQKQTEKMFNIRNEYEQKKFNRKKENEKKKTFKNNRAIYIRSIFSIISARITFFLFSLFA